MTTLLYEDAEWEQEWIIPGGIKEIKPRKEVPGDDDEVFFFMSRRISHLYRTGKINEGPAGISYMSREHRQFSQTSFFE